MMGDLVADIIPIHLMLTDVVMPEMNKRELAEHLARSRCSVLSSAPLSPSSTAPGNKSGTSLHARSG